MTPFAPLPAPTPEPRIRVACYGRPSAGCVSPRRPADTLRADAQGRQDVKGTQSFTPLRFLPVSSDPRIRHANPKAQPFCATCGAFMPEYPFGPDKCPKCQ